MPSASRIPNTVATSMIWVSDGMLLRVSTLIPAAAAVCWALWIWLAVSGCAVRISQPWVVMLPASPSSWTACSVITVFGAEVPDGRALSCWITGLFTQWPLTQGRVSSLPEGPGGQPLAVPAHGSVP